MGEFISPKQNGIEGSPYDAAHRMGHGGKPDSAMGGGSDLLKLDDALAALDGYVAEKAQ